jgi:hypothetical protein
MARKKRQRRTPGVLAYWAGSTIRFLIGQFRPDSASGLNTRRALAVSVEEIDLRELPCTCHLEGPCMACAAHDARTREREARMVSMR